MKKRVIRPIIMAAKDNGRKELQKCTKQELVVLVQARDAEIAEKAEALAKAGAKTTQLREMMVR